MFRNLKMKLISESKIVRYFWYALGEIILVVIGILIALEVNNRNMDAQAEEVELKALKELNAAFISDTADLQQFSARIKYNTQAVGTLIDVLSTDQPYHDSLDPYFAMVVTPFMWSESNSAYKTLLAKGVDIITNDDIRNDIITIHTSLYETIKFVDDGVYIKYPYIHEYCLKHFDRVGSEAVDDQGRYQPGRMTPINYDSLKADPEYHTILRTVKSQQEVLLLTLESARVQLKSTIGKINREIRSRE